MQLKIAARLRRTAIIIPFIVLISRAGLAQLVDSQIAFMELSEPHPHFDTSLFSALVLHVAKIQTCFPKDAAPPLLHFILLEKTMAADTRTPDQ